MLAISELYIQSPTEWYIEMDIAKNGFWCTYPCSTSAFRLKLSSIKDTCNLRLYVNNSGIAVITPKSIRGLPLLKSDSISLKTSDSVTIFDTAKSYNKWKFIVQPIQQGHSLIDVTPGTPKEAVEATIGFRGNPPTEYNRPFISEVSIIDSKNWALELDLQQTSIPQSFYPGNIISKLRMQLFNSSKIYSLNARFDTNGIAVLRPGDIFSGADTLKEITIPTTVKILDTCWNSTYRSGLYWRFSIQEAMDSAHSLINFGNTKTKRTSIGKRITYSTMHKIHFFDNATKPLTKAYIYYPQLERKPYEPFQDTYWYCVRLLKIEPGTFTNIEIGMNSAQNWFGFTQDSITSESCVEQSKFKGIPWIGQYIDSMPDVHDTLIFPNVVSVMNAEATQFKTQKRLVHVNSDHQRSLFSAILPANVSDAHINIMSLSGKLIAKLSFGPILHAGTYTCQWSHHQTAPAGTYLCVLVADGVEVQSVKVTIR
jgi:hypothetical protein